MTYRFIPPPTKQRLLLFIFGCCIGSTITFYLNNTPSRRYFYGLVPDKAEKLFDAQEKARLKIDFYTKALTLDQDIRSLEDIKRVLFNARELIFNTKEKESQRLEYARKIIEDSIRMTEIKY